MIMTREEVTEKIHSAYRTFLARDGHLLQVDANERSMTHKLAEYLQAEFPDWNVDCEYNRDGDLIKKMVGLLDRETTTDDTDAKSVFPDIIVHLRGTKRNLVVIEAKKSSYKDKDADEAKLRAYKDELGYKFAFKIEFPVGKEPGDFDEEKMKGVIIEI
jgi:hypothetical protein